MLTWEIAKLLIERCNSSTDVGRVIRALNDPDTIQEVCYMLSAFSGSGGNAANPAKDAPKGLADRKYGTFVPAGDTVPGPTRNRLPHSAGLTTVGQLEAIFRKIGMSNRQVEEWVTYNFEVDAKLSKDSLRSYLARVLNKSDIRTVNRMLAAAQQLSKDDTIDASDIKKYWDEMDKRFLVVE